MKALVETPDITQMSREELAGLINFSIPNGGGTIEAEAGYVIGKAQVTATNNTTNESITLVARNDGSFSIPLNNQSGDLVTLNSTDGLSTTITIP